MGSKNFFKHCCGFLNSNFFIAGAITILLWILAPAYEHRYWQKRFELEHRKIKEEKSYDLKYKAAEEFATNAAGLVAYSFMIDEYGKRLEDDPILKKAIFDKFLAYCDSYLAACVQAKIAFSDNKEVLSAIESMDDLSNKNFTQILTHEYFKYKNKEMLSAILKSYRTMMHELQGKKIDSQEINDWLEVATGEKYIFREKLSYPGPGCFSNRSIERKYPVSQKAMEEMMRKITKEIRESNPRSRINAD